MKNWKKAIALVASVARLSSRLPHAVPATPQVAARTPARRRLASWLSYPEGGFRTANEKDIQKAFEDAGFDLTTLRPRTTSAKQIQAFNKFVNDEVDAIILSHRGFRLG